MSAHDPITQVADFIMKHFSPEKIILFSHKQNLHGETTGFKLCIVSKIDQKNDLEHEIYLHADCDVPFDLLIYTADEWHKLITESDSFAQKLNQTGRVLYE